MHVRSLGIRNLRSIRKFDLELRDGETAGWHVVLGDNGSGKTTVVRALALALMGEKNAEAARQDWSRWLAAGKKSGRIETLLLQHEEDKWVERGRQNRAPIDTKVYMETESGSRKRNGRPPTVEFSSAKRADRTVWGGGEGWFSASFGPFRRFAGGDPDMNKLYKSHPRLAPHLSAFGENVALGESLRWLKDLQVEKLENGYRADDVQDAVIAFINNSGLLPHKARISEVTSKQVTVTDGLGSQVSVEDMSDGYRSILSLTFEIMRLMFLIYETDAALDAIDSGTGKVNLPGVVAIDEIDAHLHPGWQKRIGDWFVDRFPKTQFFVTTHSPIICRAARRGSVWLLPAPGSGEKPRRIAGAELDRLIDGNVLDAYDTGLFGEDVTRSDSGKAKLEELAKLNRKRLATTLSKREQRRLEALRSTMASNPNHTTGIAD